MCTRLDAEGELAIIRERKSENADTRDSSKVRMIQLELLDGYRRDFSKHAPAETWPRIGMIWDSLPAQLARENKKFMCSGVKQGMRMRHLELGLQWLYDAGLAYAVNRISKPAVPLSAYCEGAFKLFHVDVGCWLLRPGCGQMSFWMVIAFFKSSRGL